MNAVIASILASLLLLGCASKEPPRHSAAASSDSAGAASLATDPVSQKPVRTDSPWKTRWHGTWYYFDCEEHLRNFESDPTAYVREEGRPTPERLKVYPHEVR
jgi:YHS domain-containing protein